MNPPKVYELTRPNSHSTNKITNMVQSTLPPPFAFAA